MSKSKGRARSVNKESAAKPSQRSAASRIEEPLPAVQKTLDSPSKLTPSQVQSLQSRVGNRAVQRLVEKDVAQKAPDSTVLQRHTPPPSGELLASGNQKLGDAILEMESGMTSMNASWGNLTTGSGEVAAGWGYAEDAACPDSEESTEGTSG